MTCSLSWVDSQFLYMVYFCIFVLKASCIFSCIELYLALGVTKEHLFGSP